jgi:ketosteroid isomerase-like protein
MSHRRAPRARPARLAAVLLVTLAAACPGREAAGPVGPPAPEVPADVESQVRAALEQWRQAWEVRSLDALAPLYSQTDDLVVVWQGRSARGWPSVKLALSGSFEGATRVRVAVVEAHVLALGDQGALVEAILERSVGDDVKTIQDRGTLTLAFRLQDGAWKIVAEHYSFPPLQ